MSSPFSLPGGFYNGETVIVLTGRHRGELASCVGTCMGVLVTLDLFQGGRIDIDPHDIKDYYIYRSVHLSDPKNFRQTTTVMPDERVL